MDFEFWVFGFYFTYMRIGDLELGYSTYKQAIGTTGLESHVAFEIYLIARYEIH